MSKTIKKHRCSLCTDIAVVKIKNPSRCETTYYCEKCFDEHRSWEYYNPKSFIRNNDGFDLPRDIPYYIEWMDIITAIEDAQYLLKIEDYNDTKDIICDIFLKYRNKLDRKKIIYNVFMASFGSYIHSRMSGALAKTCYENNELNKFYLRVKKELSNKKKIS